MQVPISVHRWLLNAHELRCDKLCSWTWDRLWGWSGTMRSTEVFVHFLWGQVSDGYRKGISTVDIAFTWCLHQTNLFLTTWSTWLTSTATVRQRRIIFPSPWTSGSFVSCDTAVIDQHPGPSRTIHPENFYNGLISTVYDDTLVHAFLPVITDPLYKSRKLRSSTNSPI